MNARKTCPGLLLLASLAIAAPAVAATGNPWFDEFERYDSVKGTAYTSSTDAAILAWQESLMQRGYLNLYEATKNTAWLDKFVTHANTVTNPTTFTDDDGDGYVDWLTARYSPDLTARTIVVSGEDQVIVTGTFEYAATGDATLPHDWIRNGSTDTTALRTNAAGNYVGNGGCPSTTWGLQLITANGTAQRLYQDFPSYEPGRRYQLSIYGRNGGSVNGRAFVYDRTANAVLASIEVNTSAWKNYTVDFDMPAVTGHDVEIWLAHMATTPTAQSVFFDNVRMSAYHSYHVLDGMIGIPLANFVRLVNRNPGLLASFQDEADDYQAFLETNVIAKWQDSAAFYGDTWVNVSSTEGYYREPTNFDTFATTTALDPLPYNQYFVLCELQNILFDVNASSAYLDKAEKGATYFANRVTLPAGTDAYTWYYASFAGAKIEDTSHSNVDMEFISELHRSGSVFTDTDMTRFTGTLTDNLWNGSSVSPLLNNFVTGVQGGYCSNGQFSTVMYGWVPYAQFDPLAWKIAAWQYDGVTINSHTSAVTLSQIVKWDPVKLVNQGFELPAAGDATLPARWTRSLSSSTTAYRDSTNKTSGDWGMTLKSNGSTFQRLVQPWENYVASTSYTVTFDGKADSSGAQGRVLIYDVTTSTILAAYNFSNTSWQTHTFTFTSPATATDVVNIQIGHLYHLVNNGYTHYDNVVIKRTGDTW